MGTHALDDGLGPLHQLRVGRLHALGEVEVVLEADAHVATEQHRLRDPRHLHRAQRERRPDGVLRKLVDHRLQGQRVRRGAVRDAHAELVHRRGVDEALLDQGLGEPQMTGVEDLHLAADAELLDPLRAVPQDVGRRDVDQRALAEVERPAVERADLGEDLLDVLEPLDPADQIGALHDGGRLLRIEVEVAAHPRRRVDDDVDVRLADPLDHLAVVRHLTRALAGLGIAHVDVHDGRSGARRGDAGLGDLLGGHRHMLGAADGVARAGESAGDHDVAVHEELLFISTNMVVQRPFQTGARFSANALKPSIPSSEE
ncbi:MAG TPA: hypothetical protein PL137_18695 [Nocardioides sp.]|nr:hypothetical protein [Nocardioides sp.]